MKINRKGKWQLFLKNRKLAVELGAGWAYKAVFAGTYIYLALPFVIFCIGWCRWYIGVPAAVLTAASCILCLREHRDRLYSGVRLLPEGIRQQQWMKVAAIVTILLLWVGLSGIGGYVWQTEDHPVRNRMFLLLTEQKWPLIREAVAGSGLQDRGIVYYIGFWLPAAVVGKLFGTGAGWAAQYLWAVGGILLMYAHICMYRKRISLWPFIIVIFFSGMDALGVLIGSADVLQVFGDQHLEWWARNYQFSSMTTQLFWVFNQAVPAWLASALIFLGEKPRNMVFTASLMILTSVLPFMGMVPFVLYFMVSRVAWVERPCSVRQLLAECREHWASPQNLLGGGTVALVSAVYLSGNGALRESIPILDSDKRVLILFVLAVLLAAALWILAVLAARGKGRAIRGVAVAIGIATVVWRLLKFPSEEWQSPVYQWINLMVFYMVEAGVLLYVLRPFVKDKRLLVLDAACLYMIPLFMLRNSSDICMRASIPGLFLMMLWCIRAFDLWSMERKKKAYRVGICLVFTVLLVGAVTPLHEMKRNLIRTREYYENTVVDEEHLYQGRFFSGSTQGFFWKHVAKQR